LLNQYSIQNFTDKNDYDLPVKTEEAELYRQHDSMVLRAGLPCSFYEPATLPDIKQNLLSIKIPLFNPKKEVVALLGMSCDLKISILFLLSQHFGIAIIFP